MKKRKSVLLGAIWASMAMFIITVVSMSMLIFANLRNAEGETVTVNVQVTSESSTTLKMESATISARAELPVPYVSQYPELPTGCEITSLTAVLNYLGYDVSKETMADDYLPKCDATTGDYNNYFLGNPRDDDAFGCYAKPIVKAANTYLEKHDSSYSAYNYSGKTFNALLNEINEGTPVIIWSTINLQTPYVTFEWDVDGDKVEWLAPEHCVVLTGYDMESMTVKLLDPEKGAVVCDMDVVKTLYEQMSQQAVVVK